MNVMIPAKFEQLRPWFERNRRDGWNAIVRDGDTDVRASKVSGSAWLPESENWPHCPLCGEAMALFLQLDLRSAPQVHPLLTDGLMQVFHCINMDACVYGPSCGDAFATNHLIRVIALGSSGHARSAPAGTRAATAIPPRMILDWSRFDDFPDLADDETRLGLRWGESTNFGQFKDVGEYIVCEAPSVLLPLTQDDFEEALPKARRGDKLGGWPAWGNINTDYVGCPECGQLMDCMVFQFDHTGVIPVMFGDGGVGQVMCCRQHPHCFAYTWQSG